MPVINRFCYIIIRIQAAEKTGAAKLDGNINCFLDPYMLLPKLIVIVYVNVDVAMHGNVDL